MNSLSWMLYLASVAGSIGGIAAGAGVVSMIGFIGAETVGRAMLGTDDVNPEARSAFSKACLKVLIPAAIISAVIPSQDTVYAIAASEMGESALNTKTGSKAVEALNAWLDRQIKGDEK